MKDAETKSTLLRGVPVELWYRLKVQAANESLTLQAWIVKTLEHALPTKGNGKRAKS